MHVLLLDIDQFGDFNERFGIDTGDRLLVSDRGRDLRDGRRRLPTSRRSNLVARIGGEEFAVLLRRGRRPLGAPTSEDAHGARRADPGRRQKAQVDGAGVTVSVGVASLLT